jgi:putative zinc finger/helix-turn-helix YgiT family protein
MNTTQQSDVNRMLVCPRCYAIREAKPISYDEDCEIHGVEFTFHVDAFECLTCGEELADPADPDLFRPMYDAYRAASGTLRPDEVKAIRQRSGLSQVAFATILGMSPATINRYEMGVPIAIKEDNLLRMAGIPSALRMLLRQRGHLLKPGQRPKA